MLERQHPGSVPSGVGQPLDQLEDPAGVVDVRLLVGHAVVPANVFADVWGERADGLKVALELRQPLGGAASATYSATAS
jgi:hypothetical protein